MGRNKIQIQSITDDRQRCITFNKRKVGLLKKACELAVLCDIKIVLSFTDLYNNVYNFVAPDAQAIESTKKSLPGIKIYNMKVNDYPQFSKRVKLSTEPKLSSHSNSRKTIKSSFLKRKQLQQPLEANQLVDKLQKKQKLNLKIQIPDDIEFGDDYNISNNYREIEESVIDQHLSKIPRQISFDGIKSGTDNFQAQMIGIQPLSPSKLQNSFATPQLTPRLLFLVDLNNSFYYTQAISQQQNFPQGNFGPSNLSSVRSNHSYINSCGNQQGTDFNFQFENELQQSFFQIQQFSNEIFQAKNKQQDLNTRDQLDKLLSES